jgi:hypothetical protein
LTSWYDVLIVIADFFITILFMGSVVPIGTKITQYKLAQQCLAFRFIVNPLAIFERVGMKAILPWNFV